MNPRKEILSVLDKDHLDISANKGANFIFSMDSKSGKSYQKPKLDFVHMVYKDPYKKIYEVIAKFEGFEKKYYVSDSGSRAGVVVIKDESILLVGQYRLLINGISWELPGGQVDIDETPKDSAIRECMEEAGIYCNRLNSLIGYHPGMDSFCNPSYLYYCEDFVEKEKAFQANSETVERAWVKLDIAVKMIYSLQIVDAFTIIGIFSYIHKNK